MYSVAILAVKVCDVKDNSNSLVCRAYIHTPRLIVAVTTVARGEIGSGYQKRDRGGRTWSHSQQVFFSTPGNEIFVQTNPGNSIILMAAYSTTEVYNIGKHQDMEVAKMILYSTTVMGRNTN